MRSDVGCGTLSGDGLTKCIQNNAHDAKFEKRNWFEIKNKTEDRGQSVPKSIGTLTVLGCINISSKFGNPDYNQW